MAKSAESRCCGASAIPRQSFVWRQQDSGADALIVLVLKRRRKYVREVRMTKKEEEVQNRDQEEAGAYCESAMLSIDSGGAAASGSSSLATIG
jgi:hypothetical protein